MKRYLLILAFLLPACSTTQISATRALADPLVSAAVSGYAAQYGVPPVLTASLVATLQNQFWGMLAQKYAQQPIAQGSDIPAVGNAVAAKNPTTTQLTMALSALGQTVAPAIKIPTQP